MGAFPDIKVFDIAARVGEEGWGETMTDLQRKTLVDQIVDGLAYNRERLEEIGVLAPKDEVALGVDEDDYLVDSGTGSRLYTVRDWVEAMVTLIGRIGEGDPEAREYEKSLNALSAWCGISIPVFSNDWSINRKTTFNDILGLRKNINVLESVLQRRYWPDAADRSLVSLHKGLGNGVLMEDARSKDKDGKWLEIGVGDKLYFNIEDRLMEHVRPEKRKDPLTLRFIKIIAYGIRRLMQKEYYEGRAPTISKWERSKSFFDMNVLFKFLDDPERIADEIEWSPYSDKYLSANEFDADKSDEFGAGVAMMMLRFCRRGTFDDMDQEEMNRWRSTLEVIAEKKVHTLNADVKLVRSKLVEIGAVVSDAREYWVGRLNSGEIEEHEYMATLSAVESDSFEASKQDIANYFEKRSLITFPEITGGKDLQEYLDSLDLLGLGQFALDLADIAVKEEEKLERLTEGAPTKMLAKFERRKKNLDRQLEAFDSGKIFPPVVKNLLSYLRKKAPTSNPELLEPYKELARNYQLLVRDRGAQYAEECSAVAARSLLVLYVQDAEKEVMLWSAVVEQGSEAEELDRLFKALAFGDLNADFLAEIFTDEFVGCVGSDYYDSPNYYQNSKTEKKDRRVDLNWDPDANFEGYLPGYFENLPELLPSGSCSLITSVRSDSHENPETFRRDIEGNLALLAEGGVLLIDGHRQSFNRYLRFDEIRRALDAYPEGEFNAEVVLDINNRPMSVFIQRKHEEGYLTVHDKAKVFDDKVAFSPLSVIASRSDVVAANMVRRPMIANPDAFVPIKKDDGSWVNVHDYIERRLDRRILEAGLNNMAGDEIDTLLCSGSLTGEESVKVHEDLLRLFYIQVVLSRTIRLVSQPVRDSIFKYLDEVAAPAFGLVKEGSLDGAKREKILDDVYTRHYESVFGGLDPGAVNNRNKALYLLDALINRLYERIVNGESLEAIINDVFHKSDDDILGYFLELLFEVDIFEKSDRDLRLSDLTAVADRLRTDTGSGLGSNMVFDRVCGAIENNLVKIPNQRLKYLLNRAYLAKAWGVPPVRHPRKKMQETEYMVLDVMFGETDYSSDLLASIDIDQIVALVHRDLEAVIKKVLSRPGLGSYDSHKVSVFVRRGFEEDHATNFAASYNKSDIPDNSDFIRLQGEIRQMKMELRRRMEVLAEHMSKPVRVINFVDCVTNKMLLEKLEKYLGKELFDRVVEVINVDFGSPDPAEVKRRLVEAGVQLAPAIGTIVRDPKDYKHIHTVKGGEGGLIIVPGSFYDVNHHELGSIDKSPGSLEEVASIRAKLCKAHLLYPILESMAFDENLPTRCISMCFGTQAMVDIIGSAMKYDGISPYKTFPGMFEGGIFPISTDLPEGFVEFGYHPMLRGCPDNFAMVMTHGGQILRRNEDTGLSRRAVGDMEAPDFPIHPFGTNRVTGQPVFYSCLDDRMIGFVGHPEVNESDPSDVRRITRALGRFAYSIEDAYGVSFAAVENNFGVPIRRGASSGEFLLLRALNLQCESMIQQIAGAPIPKTKV